MAKYRHKSPCKKEAGGGESEKEMQCWKLSQGLEGLCCWLCRWGRGLGSGNTRGPGDEGA